MPHPRHAPDAIPLGRRRSDRPFLLLVLGLVVTFVFHTIRGVDVDLQP